MNDVGDIARAYLGREGEEQIIRAEATAQRAYASWQSVDVLLTPHACRKPPPGAFSGKNAPAKA